MKLEEMRMFMDLRSTGDDIFNMTVENRLTNMVGSGSSTAVSVLVPVLKPLSQVLEDHGYSVSAASKLARSMCRAVAKAFRSTHGGNNPPKADMRTNGRVVKVMQYGETDWPMIEVLLPYQVPSDQPALTHFFQ